MDLSDLSRCRPMAEICEGLDWTEGSRRANTPAPDSARSIRAELSQGIPARARPRPGAWCDPCLPDDPRTAVPSYPLVTMKQLASLGFSSAMFAAFVALSGCAHRYSEDPDDWMGPTDSNFNANFAECRRRMDEARFRYGGDPRLLFLDCMEKREWHLRGRS